MKKKIKQLTIATMIISAFSFSGCVNSYQPYGFANGGYKDTRISENTFNVYYRGNDLISMQRVKDFALLRASELTKNHGYKYFIIVHSSNESIEKTLTTPTTYKTVGSANVYGDTIYGKSTTTVTGGTIHYATPAINLQIKCFKRKPNVRMMVYNADYIMESIKSTYKLNN